MGPLREIIARFSVAIDDAPLKRLDGQIDRIKSSYGAMALAGVGAMATLTAASYRFVQAASDVEEVDNKIGAIFGKERTDEITEWSRTVEKEMGRSEYAFRKTFSDFAAFLDPMKIGTEKTIEFSKNLAKLSVDLASFYNTSEEEARMRLFSGISGETEAVRRLGIDISDTSLTDLYQSEENPLDPGHPGHAPGKRRNKGKGLASLSLQEKTILRYTKILKDTAKAQGDAARTAGGWANTLKRLTDRWYRVEVAMGRLIKTEGVKLLNFLESGAEKFEWLTTKTQAFQTAFGIASVSIVAATYRWAAANTALLASYAALLPEILAIASAFLVIEDFVTFMKDGKSVFGDLAGWITGLKNPLRAVEEIIERLVYGFKSLGQLGKLFYDFTKFLTGMDDGGAFLEGLKGLKSMKNPFGAEFGAEQERERKKAQADAVERGDVKAFTAARGRDDAYEDQHEKFLKARGEYLLNGGMDNVSHEDVKAGFAKPLPNGDFMTIGGIAVSPTFHITIHANEDPKKAGEDFANGFSDEMKKAMADLARRGKKEK